MDVTDILEKKKNPVYYAQLTPRQLQNDEIINYIDYLLKNNITDQEVFNCLYKKFSSNLMIDVMQALIDKEQFEFFICSLDFYLIFCLDDSETKMFLLENHKNICFAIINGINWFANLINSKEKTQEELNRCYYKFKDVVYKLFDLKEFQCFITEHKILSFFNT